ncbi:MAG: ATP-dependent DNA helicase PcrA, partial [Clostridia bacterium]|nr:ATP-dependent DNA helicase PcrA [Clostridia bacterium]
GLTYRIAYLINTMRVSPYNILAITFTNKATNEMKARMERLVGESSGLWVSTFHSLCARILRRHIDLLGYSKDYSIYDDIETTRVMKRILKNKHLEEKAFLNKALWHISNAKNKGYSPEEYTREGFTDSDTIFELYDAYERELRQSNALDYDDLLLKTVVLFQQYPEVLREYQHRFKYIHIDEYQDTNRIQYILVRLLAAVYGNLFAVGDEDQSIYSWRGADINNMLDFRKNYPESKIFKLEQNYRSTSSILKAANALIKNNTSRLGKTLWTDKGEGVKVEIYKSISDREEADYVIRQISMLIREKGYSPKDFAILVRLNALTREFEERFNLYNIPFKVFGGYKFFERKEIKDVVAYLKAIVNPRDNEAMLRIINTPKRGIGDSVLEALTAYCSEREVCLADVLLSPLDNTDFAPSIKKKLSIFAELFSKLLFETTNMTIGEIVRFVIREAGFEMAYNKEDEEDYNKLLNIFELVNSMEKHADENKDATLSDYLQSVSLMTDTDNIATDDYVTVATVHAVKGLEFPVVFVVALEENIFPSGIFIKNESEIEEERRVMYVAMTRAEQRLYLTHSSARRRFGKDEYNAESRFLKEIKAELYPQTNTRPAAYYPPKSDSISDTVMATQYIKNITAPIVKTSISVTAGQKVEHAKYGEGMVISVRGDNASIAFEGIGIKQFNMTIAPVKIKG